MQTRALLALFASLLVIPATLLAQTPTQPSQVSPATKMSSKNQTPEGVQKSAIVIDTHADTPQRFVDENFDLGDPLNGGNFNLETARKGNLGAEFFPAVAR